MKFSRPLRFALLAGSCLLLAACAASAPKSAADKAKADEYTYYTPTGSNIPVRVRKADLKATDAESASDQAALRRAAQHGTKQPSGN